MGTDGDVSVHCARVCVAQRTAGSSITALRTPMTVHIVRPSAVRASARPTSAASGLSMPASTIAPHAAGLQREPWPPRGHSARSSAAGGPRCNMPRCVATPAHHAAACCSILAVTACGCCQAFRWLYSRGDRCKADLRARSATHCSSCAVSVAALAALWAAEYSASAMRRTAVATGEASRAEYGRVLPPHYGL